MDFNERLAELAGDGVDMDAPIPRRRRLTPIYDFYYADEEDDEQAQDNDDDAVIE